MSDYGDKDEIASRQKQHEEDMKLMAAESDFLDTKPLWATGANTYIIIGPRVGGKTFGCLKKCIEDYKKYGKRFIYVRRWDKTITKRFIADLLEPFVINRFVKKPLVKELWGDTYDIRYKVGKFEVFNRDDPDEEPEVVGYLAALNTGATIKSTFTEESNVYNFILDEFLPMLSERLVPEEYDAYENLLSTACRSHLNQSVVYLVGNTVSKYSEYLYNYGITYDMLDIKHQGEIQQIILPEDDEHVEEHVTFLNCKPNPKLAKMNSLHIRKSKMITGENWELKATTFIPHIQGEQIQEKLLCTIHDPFMHKDLGFFVRKSKNTVLKDIHGIKVPKTYLREFIIVKMTDRISKNWNLTTIKGLSYNNWMSLDKMFKDIKEYTGIDIMDEIIHTRVFCENPDTGDVLFKLYDFYNRLSFKDTF